MVDLKALGLSLVLSVGVHGAIGWAALEARSADSARREAAATEIDVEVREPTEPAPPPPPPSPPPAEEEPAPGLVHRRRPRPNAQPTPPPSPEPPSVRASGEERERPEPRPGPEPEPSSETVAELIDPARVARMAVGGPASGRVAVPTDEGHAEAAGRALSHYLARRANDKPWLTHAEPELTEGPGGTYRYDGPSFDAVIEPDGTVRFADGNDGKASYDHGAAKLHFDVTDAVMRKNGADPYGAEKRWFMRETEDLRDRMARDHHARSMGRALTHLEARLSKIWRGAGLAAARRRRIFALWDGLSEDEMGSRARSVVVGFVRDTLPEGSADAYTAAELDRLNAHRHSRAPFAPYQSPSP